MIDLLDYAQKLIIRNIFEAGNPTGIVTDRRLYDPTVQGSRAPGSKLTGGAKWPADGKGRGAVKHATVGTNSLNYLARGSTLDGRWVSAQYHFPKDDYTVNKIVPDGYGCNHCYPGSWRGYVNNINSNFYGFEVENLQNGVDPFTEAQYIKLAFVWAYLSQRDGISDYMIADHRIIAPPGHRTDPTTGGLWNEGKFWFYVWGIRQDARVWQLWGLPQPKV